MRIHFHFHHHHHHHLLLDAGWNPHSATAWEDPDDNEWNTIEDGQDVDLSPILSAVAASPQQLNLELRSTALEWKRG